MEPLRKNSNVDRACEMVKADATVPMRLSAPPNTTTKKVLDDVELPRRRASGADHGKGGPRHAGNPAANAEGVAVDLLRVDAHGARHGPGSASRPALALPQPIRKISR